MASVTQRAISGLSGAARTASGEIEEWSESNH
jgi:hypothetical protein